MRSKDFFPFLMYTIKHYALVMLPCLPQTLDALTGHEWPAHMHSPAHHNQIRTRATHREVLNGPCPPLTSRWQWVHRVRRFSSPHVPPPNAGEEEEEGGERGGVRRWTAARAPQTQRQRHARTKLVRPGTLLIQCRLETRSTSCHACQNRS